MSRTRHGRVNASVSRSLTGAVADCYRVGDEAALMEDEAMAQSIKIPDDLMELARPEAERQSRSVTGQIAHWAKIGRAVERSGRFSYKQIDAALAGALLPEDLSAEESAVYEEEFCKAVGVPTEEERAFFADRRARGLGVGLDETGRIVHAKNRL